MRGALLVPLLLLAGCLDAPSGGPHRLGGSFTAEATQAQVDEARALAEAEGGDMAVMESFPLQFGVTGLSGEACGRLRAALDAKPYVASVGACQEARPLEEPAGIASSPSRGMRGRGPAPADRSNSRTFS